jgi:hypothetical protein
MAILKNNKSSMQIQGVYEDPRPSGNRIYFWSEGFNKENLQYIMTSGLSHNTAGTNLTNWGYPSYGPSNDWQWDGIILTTGNRTHVQHVSTTNNNFRNNLDMQPFMSMDINNPVRTHWSWEDDTGNVCIYSGYNQYQYRNANPQFVYEKRFNPGGELDNNLPNASSTTAFYNSWAIYRNPTTNNLIALVNAADASGGAYPNNLGPGRVTGVFNTSTVGFSNSTTYVAVIFQFLGTDPSGFSIWQSNSQDNDYTQIFYRYDDSANTLTVLSTINAIPSAGGSSAGGNRGTGFGNTRPKFSSKYFTDPTNANNRAWYTPYLDSTGNYVPFYYQWTPASNTFTRNTNCTVNYPGGNNQTTYWLPDTLSAANSQTAHAMQSPWYNEVFQINNTGTRYLTLFQLHGSGNVYDAQPKMRTLMTYSIDAADPKILNYHSSVIIPTTPQNIVWLDDYRTLLGVIAQNNFYIYSFNSTTGWVLTATLPYRYDAVGRDASGRIWAIDRGPALYGRLHVITPAVPTTVSVATAENVYNYQSVAINSTATVNAYDASGNRIIANVTLRCEGNSVRIVDGGVELSEYTVTTSSSADTTVNIRIIAAGQTNIVASVNI